MPRMLRCSVLDVPLKTPLLMKLGYVKKTYKNTMGEVGLQTIALCTLSSNI